MLDPHASAPGQRVRKTGDVAGREDAGALVSMKASTKTP
jgi:hypothetical protein